MASRFRGVGLDLQQELRPYQSRDNEQQRGRPRAAEMASANLGVGRDIGATQQILRDLHEVVHRHVGALKHGDDVGPGQLRLGADIRRHLGEQFADSLTSREILRSTKLSEAGRGPLRDIIARVEWTYFGKHPAEREDYAACRASFDALARALHGRRAA